MDHNAPYESPIEQYLFTKLRSHLLPTVAFTPQVSYGTQCGVFRVDGVLVFEQQKIALECDGAEYHDSYRDEWRDAILLGENHVNAVLRFGGSNIIDVPLVCLSDISRWYSEFFWDRALSMLAAARNEVEFQFENEDYSYGTYTLNGSERCFGSSRRFQSERREMWRGYYKFAQRNPGKSLDRIVELWKHSDRGAARIVNGN